MKFICVEDGDGGGLKMIVAVQLCFRTPPPVVVCREDLPEEWARPKKVSTNQLIIEGEETFWQATAEPQRKSMCDGVIVCRGCGTGNKIAPTVEQWV